ncbi:Phycobilisome 7.8 kDa linker polypeptide, allophycocyanin-associated, core [Galdieria sulphuraria]|nr:Phycobilisome 7.8 kDa linker polypeptide, allophycocyanin-associated, core [Galdieria sulphuraria]
MNRHFLVVLLLVFLSITCLLLYISGPSKLKSHNNYMKKATVLASSFGMNGSSLGTLGGVKYKNSGVANDGRCFKITYCQPSQSRGFSGRELQNVYTTKLVPFSSWYAEQQRIMKMGGKIFKVELAVGKKERNVGNM